MAIVRVRPRSKLPNAVLRLVPLLLVLAGCAKEDGGISGGSVTAIPPTEVRQPIGGDIVVRPGVGGMQEAQDFARTTCEGYHLTAKIKPAPADATRIAYTCE